MKIIYYFSFLFIFFVACQKETSPAEESLKTNIHLVSDEQYSSFSKFNLQFIALSLGNELSAFTFTSVQGIKIVYNTLDEFNKPIEASGMLLIPEGFDTNGPMISFQHATLSSKNEAPTQSGLGANELSFGSVISGIGAVVAIADYVGFGHSIGQQHPYHHKENTAQSTYDFLLAANEYLNREKIKTNGELFLMGYSQGGHATMALHQKIEKENKYQVTHSLPGGGAYNLSLFIKEILSKDEKLPFMVGYIWLIDAYNRIYNTLNRPLSDYFNEPYATNLEGLEEINAGLEVNLIDQNPQKLFKKELIDDFLNGEDTALIEIIAQNNVYDWSPKAPITLFHGTADDYVFAINAESALKQIKDNGGKINYIPLEGLGHTGALQSYLLCSIKIIFE